MHTRILAIIPNENAGTLFIEATKNIKDVYIEVRHATMQSAASLASSLENNFEVIIARGETAKLISQKVKIPVVELDFATHELLSAIRQSEAIGKPFAVVGFPSLTNRAQRLADLMAKKLTIYTIFDTNDAEIVLEKVYEAGYRVIVSGTGLSQYISRFNFTIISIMTTMPSIENVVIQAVLLGQTIIKQKKLCMILEKLLKDNEEKHIVFNENNDVVFSNIEPLNIPISTFKKLNSSKNEIPMSMEKTINGKIYSIKYKKFVLEEETYIDFLVSVHSLSLNIQTGIIKTFTAIEAKEAFLSHFPHFSDISFSAATQTEYKRIGSISSPIIICGEKGTGKKQVAALIYQNSKYVNHLFYLIECDQMNERNWTTFLESSDSPLTMKDHTICINSLSKLNDSKLERLKNFINESNLTSRIKIIFCYETIPNTPIPPSIRSFINDIGALTKNILPLRERKNELLPLAHIYTNSFDEIYCKEVIGLSPEAEATFLSYQWPGNLTQFKRVMAELVLNTSACYISEENVLKALDKEKAHMTSASTLSSVIDINKPMAEIEKDIAKAIVIKCNGNKTKAAEKLGITRTTLWRLLSN